jgi:hypothetical protein
MIVTTIWLANAIFAYHLFVHCDLGYGRENYRLLETATIRVSYNSAPFATGAFHFRKTDIHFRIFFFRFRSKFVFISEDLLVFISEYLLPIKLYAITWYLFR